ncbi:hypothetical protein IGI58_003395 [Enterococcus sp. AZ020]|uniref:Uncharacterized protein n=1 Tax=Candidatus Enterococcus dunnyi TaxID=1834192 RepID=A0A200JFI7_9ENTE|nr:hypothetical protein A5889_000833 [Enterococcus sp. 9D6_DIV0238]
MKELILILLLKLGIIQPAMQRVYVRSDRRDKY